MYSLEQVCNKFVKKHQEKLLNSLHKDLTENTTTQFKGKTTEQKMEFKLIPLGFFCQVATDKSAANWPDTLDGLTLLTSAKTHWIGTGLVIYFPLRELSHVDLTKILNKADAVIHPIIMADTELTERYLTAMAHGLHGAMGFYQDFFVIAANYERVKDAILAYLEKNNSWGLDDFSERLAAIEAARGYQRDPACETTARKTPSPQHRDNADRQPWLILPENCA